MLLFKLLKYLRGFYILTSQIKFIFLITHKIIPFLLLYLLFMISSTISLNLILYDTDRCSNNGLTDDYNAAKHWSNIFHAFYNVFVITVIGN